MKPMMACMAQANQKKLTQAPLVIFIVGLKIRGMTDGRDFGVRKVA
jgi:hypothetical protein